MKIAIIISYTIIIIAMCVYFFSGYGKIILISSILLSFGLHVVEYGMREISKTSKKNQ